MLPAGVVACRTRHRSSTTIILYLIRIFDQALRYAIDPLMSRFDRGPSAGTPAAALAAPPAARPRLDVYDGDTLIETIRLTEGSHCLGRDTDACDVALEHASCSRRHARLAVDARGGVLLEDLGSAQGTFLDGASTPLAALERVRLKEGASVTFAALPRRYVYRSGAQAPATAPAPAAPRADVRTGAQAPASTAPAPAAAAPLDADAKRKKLWGAPKKDALEKWGEAAGSLGGARGDKFLKLLGGAKHGATAKKRKAESKPEDDLERQYESARRRGGAWNRQGLG